MSTQESFTERQIVAALLGEFDLPGGVQRVWSGQVTLQDVAAHDWQPIGDFGVIRLPEVTDGFQNNETVVGFRRAANDNRLDYGAFVQAANADRQLDVFGREFTIYVQTFSVTGGPFGDPVTELAGQMSHLRTAKEGSSGYSIELVCETYFVDGFLPPAGFLTAEDQRMRFPDDAGLDLIPNAATRSVTWPLG